MDVLIWPTLLAIAIVLARQGTTMATLSEAIQELNTTVNDGLNAIASAVEDLKNPNVDNTEAIAAIENATTALRAGFDSLKEADPTPGD